MMTLHIDSKTLETLAGAPAERARNEKPRIKVIEFGKYEITSSTDCNKKYLVVANSETRELSCNCPARKPCKHLAAVLPVHVFLARQRQEPHPIPVEGEPESCTCSECGRWMLVAVFPVHLTNGCEAYR